MAGWLTEFAEMSHCSTVHFLIYHTAAYCFVKHNSNQSVNPENNPEIALLFMIVLRWASGHYKLTKKMQGMGVQCEKPTGSVCGHVCLYLNLKWDSDSDSCTWGLVKFTAGDILLWLWLHLSSASASRQSWSLGLRESLSLFFKFKFK